MNECNISTTNIVKSTTPYISFFIRISYVQEHRPAELHYGFYNILSFFYIILIKLICLKNKRTLLDKQSFFLARCERKLFILIELMRDNQISDKVSLYYNSFMIIQDSNLIKKMQKKTCSLLLILAFQSDQANLQLNVQVSNIQKHLLFRYTNST
jgi:hypothetical protein